MDSNHFVTLSKDQKSFLDYLKGEFSSKKRAIPIHTFSVNTPKEKVTFELKPIEQIQKPNIFIQILKLSRPLYWVFTLGPLIILIALNQSLGLTVDYLNLTLCFISLILLNLSAFSLNDYYDHLAGVDRISRTSGSQVIQKGWLSANQVKIIAFICLALAGIVSVPIFISQPSITIVLAIFVAIALFAFSYKDLGLKYKGIGEFVVFMALGPLIMLGLSTAISSKIYVEHFGVGVCLGWVAMIHMQIKNWMHIMADSQAGIKTFISRLGFDKAKWYLCFQFLILFIISVGVFYLPITKNFAVLFCILVAVGGVFICKKILKVHSPVSSQLKIVYNYAMTLNWLYCFIFTGILLFGNH